MNPFGLCLRSEKLRALPSDAELGVHAAELARVEREKWLLSNWVSY